MRRMRLRAEAGHLSHLTQVKGMEVDPAYWFAKQTDKIELYHKVERQLGQGLLHQVRDLEWGDKPALVIVNVGGRLAGFVVDAIMGVQDVAADEIKPIRGEEYVLGVVETGDAAMRVFDLERLFCAAASQGRRVSLALLLDLEETQRAMGVVHVP